MRSPPPARRSWPSSCGRCSRSSASPASAPPPHEPAMKPSLADRLSRAVVGCYPPRWKQRYAAELLDVLDQHRAGPRTVLSLAGSGYLSDHTTIFRNVSDAQPALAPGARTVADGPAAGGEG